MRAFTAVMLFAIIWWTVLFAVLPIGVRTRPEPDPTTGWRGLPVGASARRVIAITTLATLVLWGLALFVSLDTDLLSFRHGILAWQSWY